MVVIRVNVLTPHTLYTVLLERIPYTLRMAASLVDMIIGKKKSLQKLASELKIFQLTSRKKKWSEVKTELTRFMYETRGAVRGLSKTREQQEVAASFFDAIERCSLNATLKKQEDCMKGATDALASIEKFVSLI